MKIFESIILAKIKSFFELNEEFETEGVIFDFGESLGSERASGCNGNPLFKKNKDCVDVKFSMF
ncbi:MAG: hypothetical protein Q4G27_02715 [Flavobacteriaceae bacterium]|nr:hypothetical protein [Flavobacteriaceae bacterium]